MARGSGTRRRSCAASTSAPRSSSRSGAVTTTWRSPPGAQPTAGAWASEARQVAGTARWEPPGRALRQRAPHRAARPLRRRRRARGAGRAEGGAAPGGLAQPLAGDRRDGRSLLRTRGHAGHASSSPRKPEGTDWRVSAHRARQRRRPHRRRRLVADAGSPAAVEVRRRRRRARRAGLPRPHGPSRGREGRADEARRAARVAGLADRLRVCRRSPGTFRLQAGAGQFTKMDPGVGKLLGVLSLQALPRRITLDFRDVFSEGFAFDEHHRRRCASPTA